MKKVKIIKIRDYPLVGMRKEKQERPVKRAFDIAVKRTFHVIYRVSAYDRDDALQKYHDGNADEIDEDVYDERVMEVHEC